MVRGRDFAEDNVSRSRPEPLSDIARKIHAAFEPVDDAHRGYICAAWAEANQQQPGCTWEQLLQDQDFCRLFNVLFPTLPQKGTKTRLMLEMAINRVEESGMLDLRADLQYLLDSCKAPWDPDEADIWQRVLHRAYKTPPISQQRRLVAYLRLRVYLSCGKTGWKKDSEKVAKTHADQIVARLISLKRDWREAARYLAHRKQSLTRQQVAARLPVRELGSMLWDAYSAEVKSIRMNWWYKHGFRAAWMKVRRKDRPADYNAEALLDKTASDAAAAN